MHKTVPMLQGFPTRGFQKNGQTVHIVHYSICHNLLKILQRFMKANLFEDKYGSELADKPCNDVKYQLSESEQES